MDDNQKRAREEEVKRIQEKQSRGETISADEQKKLDEFNQGNSNQGQSTKRDSSDQFSK